ncbi:MAG: CDP-diacylglycerol--glycerol-3-phosphate 3-phosphatidyltransferase [Coriobacteriia bacterium]|nr:CDP-diacylglycerol--glycerol-3-phosphate 3-phosphatidyltransferase [Coriobacteriia bacterium]
MESGKNRKLGVANTVTLTRIFLIPIFLVILLVDWPSLPLFASSHQLYSMVQPILAAFVFAIIAATDAVDGYLARSRNEVTTFGKFVDPLADKLLVTAALMALVELQAIPAWIAFVIIAREFLVSGLRMIAVAEGVVIAASPLGKFKTVLQIVSICMLIVVNGADKALWSSAISHGLMLLSYATLAAAVVVTIWSMVDYFSKASDVLEGPWNR